jgi:hypothetical protein
MNNTLAILSPAGAIPIADQGDSDWSVVLGPSSATPYSVGVVSPGEFDILLHGAKPAFISEREAMNKSRVRFTINLLSAHLAGNISKYRRWRGWPRQGL